MKKVLKLAREGTGGATSSNSAMRLAVQDYWRKLGYPEGLRDDGRRFKNVRSQRPGRQIAAAGKLGA
jgi:hypothetical protein